jgi:O-antigen/teichoic acid export membrane protein
LFKNIGSNWILNGLQILVLMYLTPYVVGTLGRDVNGVWVLIVSLTGFLSLLILGVPMASVRYVAEQVAREDEAGVNRALSTCLGICIALGAGALVVGLGLYGFFEVVYLRGELAALPAATLSDARIAFLVVVLQVAFGFALRLPYGIFDAHHDFVVRNAIMAGELVLRLTLTVGLLAWSASLWVLAAVQVACMVFEFALCRAVIARRYPRLSFSLSSFDRGLVRSVLSFSVFALLLNVGSMLAFRTDAMVIGANLDAGQVTSYDIGNKFFEPMTTLVLGIAMVVMPTATKLGATGRTGELADVLLKWSKVCFSIVLGIGLYLLILGPEFLGWWVGPEYAGPSGRVLRILMVSFLAFLPVRGVALPILLGLGKPGRPALALLAMGVLNVAISVALVGGLGIRGVALGTAIPNVLFAAALLWLACRELSVRVWTYVVYVGGRALLGALPVAALGLWLKNGFGVPGFTHLFVSGIAMVALFAVTSVVFVYRNDRLLDLRAEIARRLPGAAREGQP